MDTFDNAPASLPVGRPVRRRRRTWLWVGLSAVWVVVVSICGPVGVWFVQGTAAASQGAGDPSAAALTVLLGTDKWQDDDLGDVLPYLCPENLRQVKAKVAGIRADLLRAHGDFKLIETDFKTVQNGDTATVTARVGVNQTVVGPNGDVSFYTDEGMPWTFETKRYSGLEKGWKVCDFQFHTICGEYLEC